MKTGTGEKSRSRQAGAVLQGIVLGLLVALAVTEMWTEAGDRRIFRYQSF